MPGLTPDELLDIVRAHRGMMWLHGWQDGDRRDVFHGEQCDSSADILPLWRAQYGNLNRVHILRVPLGKRHIRRWTGNRVRAVDARPVYGNTDHFGTQRQHHRLPTQTRSEGRTDGG